MNTPNVINLVGHRQKLDPKNPAQNFEDELVVALEDLIERLKNSDPMQQTG